MIDPTSVSRGDRDASPLLQKLLDGAGDVHIPAGDYLLGDTLRVPSGTSIIAEPGTRFHMADGACTHCRHFMITNANPGNGNESISLQGGVWNANNAGNSRGADQDPFAFSGVAINFTNVKNLAVRGLAIHNPESFFIRIGEVADFLVENIDLSSDSPRLNNDGVHVGGYSEDGIIRNIRATGAEVPNDDMVALNADDDVERQLNLGMRRGPIRRIVVEDIEAEDAYTFIRLLSVSQPIEDITIRRLKGGCRVHGINLNNWRFPRGVGNISRVTIEDVCLTKTALSESAPAIVKVSLKVDDVTIRNFRRGAGTHPDIRTLLIDNQQALSMRYDGALHTIDGANGYEASMERIGEIQLRNAG